MMIECQVNPCRNRMDAKGFCKIHNQRLRIHGTATPIKICFGCKTEFIWETRAFIGRAYCDTCINLITQYHKCLPSRLSSIQAHGVTIVWYIKTLVTQDFSCKICKFEWTKGNRGLCIDHDHNCCPGPYSCGKCIRGLLCDPCNFWIGRYEKDSDILDRVREYVG